MYRSINIIALFLCVFIQSGLSNKLSNLYITEFKSIAVAEMRKSGIPASIKIAQGMLESDLGRSELATKANNHFGIKCGKDWKSDVFYKFDDDLDTAGTVVESCFRSYNLSSESYTAHTNFLTNPSKKSRYGFLFNLSTTDYVGWANGLKFSGYATDPTYPSKLIKLIETHQLYKYDEPLVMIKPLDEVILVSDTTNKSENKVKETYDSKKGKESKPIISKADSKKENIKILKLPSKYIVERVNNVAMVVASGGETLEDIAISNRVDVFDILSYNEGINSQYAVLSQGEIIFLDKKKKSSEAKDFHTVAKGESLYQISQKYGVRLENILSKNHLKEDAIVIAGEKISLIKSIPKNDAPKHSYQPKFDRFLDLGDTK